MHGKLLQEYIVELAKITFEQYKKNMSIVVYVTKCFNIYGTFSFVLNGNIISVEKDLVNVSSPPLYYSIP